MKMPKTLPVPDLTKVTTLTELKLKVEEFFKTMQDVYLQIHNDINWKESIYFTARGKKWRIIPDGDNLHVEKLTGSDWRNPTHWTRYARWVHV